jgi:uncharacterized protein (TIGR00645 family)
MFQTFERAFATLLLASRWLMAPLYLGLVASLVVILIVFFRGLVQAIAGFGASGGGDIILAILKLIDLILLGNLILIIIGAGVDSIVSQAAVEERVKRPQWMGKIDFAALKIKIVASIIAIAAVDLLETYLKIETMDKSDVLWSILVFLAFVVSGVLLAWMDRLAAGPHE